MLEKMLRWRPLRKLALVGSMFTVLASCDDKVVRNYYYDVEGGSPRSVDAMQETYEIDGDNDVCSKQVLLYADKDNDGFGNAEDYKLACEGEFVPGYFDISPTDCNDNHKNIRPGKVEDCNGVDDNCNDLIDEGVQKACYSSCVGGEGIQKCTNGIWEECSLPLPKKEVLNGEDDDCNGTIDDCVLWTFPVNTCNNEKVVSIGPLSGTVYVTGIEGKLSAINSESGDVEWENKIGYSESFITNPIISVDETIYVYSLEQKILKAANMEGISMWEQSLGPCMGADGVGANEFVEGSITLSLSSKNTVLINMHLWEDDAFFDDHCGKLVAMSSLGKQWEYNINYYSGEYSPIGFYDKVYVTHWYGSSEGYRLEEVDPESGQVLDYYSFGGGFNSSPVFGNDEFYLPISSKVVKVSKYTKEVVWEFPTGNTTSPPVVDANGISYFGSSDGNFYAVDPTGEQKWVNMQDKLGTTTSATLTENGAIYVSALEGVYGINRETGEVLFNFKEGPNHEKVQPEVITLGIEGNIYFCNKANNQIYALSGEAPLDADAPWPTWLHDSQHTGNFNSGK